MNWGRGNTARGYTRGGGLLIGGPPTRPPQEGALRSSSRPGAAGDPQQGRAELGNLRLRGSPTPVAAPPVAEIPARRRHAHWADHPKAAPSVEVSPICQQTCRAEGLLLPKGDLQTVGTLLRGPTTEAGAPPLAANFNREATDSGLPAGAGSPRRRNVGCSVHQRNRLRCARATRVGHAAGA